MCRKSMKWIFHHGCLQGALGIFFSFSALTHPLFIHPCIPARTHSHWVAGSVRWTRRGSEDFSSALKISAPRQDHPWHSWLTLNNPVLNSFSSTLKKRKRNGPGLRTISHFGCYAILHAIHKNTFLMQIIVTGEFLFSITGGLSCPQRHRASTAILKLMFLFCEERKVAKWGSSISLFLVCFQLNHKETLPKQIDQA